MTTHYIDITLLPDPEFSQVHLLGALYSKLHRALVALRADNIGVSFPAHVHKPIFNRSLGAVLRLHGEAQALRVLMDLDWLKGMRDHVTIAEPALAPVGGTRRLVLRRQFKTNAERLRRRRMQRKGETAEQAATAIPDSMEHRPDLPFVQLRSSSTAQPFCLFVEHRETEGECAGGSFSAYGLSCGASIPWF